MNIFLAPHSDDETLFGAYILLRHRPLVVVCFEGRRRRRDAPAALREAETAAAMAILGCEHRCLGLPSGAWESLETLLASLDVDHAWAPLPEEDGHSQHNGVGELALRLWPGRVTLYATYTMGGGKTTRGDRVEAEPGWPVLKRQALACYASQIARPGTSAHFERDIAEYTIEPVLA